MLIQPTTQIFLLPLQSPPPRRKPIRPPRRTHLLPPLRVLHHPLRPIPPRNLRQRRTATPSPSPSPSSPAPPPRSILPQLPSLRRRPIPLRPLPPKSRLPRAPSQFLQKRRLGLAGGAAQTCHSCACRPRSAREWLHCTRRGFEPRAACAAE